MSEKKKSKKLSKGEIDNRRAALRKAASDQLAKGEQINFRIEEKFIRELQNLPSRNGRPLGTMIREWVLERLTQEKLAEVDGTGRALLILDETYSKLKDIFDSSQIRAETAEAPPPSPSKRGRAKKIVPESKRKAV